MLLAANAAISTDASVTRDLRATGIVNFDCCVIKENAT